MPLKALSQPFRHNRWVSSFMNFRFAQLECEITAKLSVWPSMLCFLLIQCFCSASKPCVCTPLTSVLLLGWTLALERRQTKNLLQLLFNTSQRRLWRYISSWLTEGITLIWVSVVAPETKTCFNSAHVFFFCCVLVITELFSMPALSCRFSELLSKGSWRSGAAVHPWNICMTWQSNECL